MGYRRINRRWGWLRQTNFRTVYSDDDDSLIENTDYVFFVLKNKNVAKTRNIDSQKS